MVGHAQVADKPASCGTGETDGGVGGREGVCVWLEGGVDASLSLVPSILLQLE